MLLLVCEEAPYKDLKPYCEKGEHVVKINIKMVKAAGFRMICKMGKNE